MSRQVDEKVVQMQFDNKEFERNVQTSMNTIDKLKQNLKFDGATKGLEEINSATKKVDMSALSSGVEAVKVKFSALQVMAVTALSNITNSAINAGKRIVSALTIDPIKTGFSEYETQINAVQTILANTESKGTTLKDVNNALDELNAYADKTIYNFTEMTRNIGTFTAAGTDLDTSVKAIQGIANLAAVSGSTSQQASTAMYQLSQALSSGTVKLMDWNSVVNAGMGGQVFQDALKETARIHGVKIDDMIKKEGSFRETLKDGWLTSEILTETLEKFTLTTEGLTEAEIKKNREMLKGKGYTDEQIDAIFKLGNTATNAATKVKTFTQLFDTLKEAAQSGWTQSWEIIVGDFEEAKALLTTVSNVIGDMINKSSQARNEMLQGWKDLGGRKVLIEAIGNAFKDVLDIVKPIKEALNEIFPPTTAQQLFDLTKKIKDFTENFKITDDVADKIKRTFKGFFATIDIGIQLFKGVTSGLKNLLGYLAPVGDGFLGFTANLGDAIVKFNEFLKSGDVFNKVFIKITTVLGKIINGVRNFVSKVANAFKEFSNIDTSGVDNFTDKIKLRFEPFTKLFEGIGKIFGALFKLIKKLAPIFFTLASKIGDIFSELGDKVNTAVENADFDSIMDIINGLLSGGLIIAIKKFIDKLTNIVDEADGFLESFKNIFDGVGDTLKAFQSQLKANALLKIAGAIGILAVSLVVISMIDSQKLGASLAAISVLFTELMITMGVFTKTIGKSKGSVTKTSTAMLAMSVAVLILASAMKKIASIESDSIVKALASVGALMAMVLITTKILSKGSGEMTKGLTGLIAIAVAIRVLAGAVEKLGAIDSKSLTKGLVGVGVLLAELMIFMKAIDSSKMGLGKGLGLLLLATSLVILSDAVEKLGALDIKTLGKGLLGIAGVLGILIGFIKALGEPKKIISTATGITILSAAMLILVKAISNMGKLSWEEIGKGLTGLAGGLGLIIATMHALPKGIGLKATGLVILSSALLILGKAISNMGGMSWEEIGKGLTVLASSLGLMVAVLYALPKSALAGSAAILVMSAALLMLAPALMMMGSMSLSEVGTGLLALAGVFVVLGVAGYALGGLAPQILILSAAIALLGVGCAAVGVGVMLFATGLTTLAGAGTAAAVAIVAIVSGLVGLIPMVLEALANGIIAFARVIGEGGPAICSAIQAVLLAIIEALTVCIPPLLECLGKILIGILGFLDECVPPLLETLGKLLEGLLEFIVSYVPKIVDAAIRLIIGLLDGIASRLPEVIASAVNLVMQFVYGIAMAVPQLVDAGFKMIIDFLNGMATAIDDNNELLIEAVDNLMDSVVEAVKQWFEHFKESGGDLMDGLIEGVKGAATDVWNSIVGVVEDAWNGVKNFFGIHSPSTVAAEAGMFIDKGLALGLDKFAGAVGDSAEGVGETAMDSLSNAISGISDMVSEDIDSYPTIRPVLDLTDIQNGEKQLSKMLNQGQTISVDSASIKASTIANDMGHNYNTNGTSTDAKQGASFSFTQNNYSPKALSKADIYRQTKNQFSAMKGALAR